MKNLGTFLGIYIEIKYIFKLGISVEIKYLTEN